MRALLSISPGGPASLSLAHDLPPPTPAEDEVVVRVFAAGVNFPDVLIIEDKYQFKPDRPFAPCSEFSGTVAAIGANVAHLKVGDRVAGTALWGGMAELVAVKANDVFVIPEAMSFEIAAGFLLTYATSWHALQDRARLKAGETLLILGAAGGVGLAALELGKAMGARVVAAVSSQEKLDFCLSRGADAGLVYERGPLSPEAQRTLAGAFKDATGGAADVIYDAVGGDCCEPALRAIAWEGRYLVVGFASGTIPRIPLNLVLLKSCQVVGVFWGTWAKRNPLGNRENVAELMKLYELGVVHPHISAQFPLQQGGAAIAHLASRKALGKVIVTMDNPTEGVTA